MEMDIEEFDLESGGDGRFRNGDALFGMLAELRQAGKFCDAVIRVKNQSYPIHRNIMSSCSPYFKSLFTSQAFSTKKKEITIPGLPAEIVGIIIDFAYTRTAKLTPDNIEILLPVADQYHVTGLLKLCCEYLYKSLTHENCLGILRFAQAHNCKGLEKAALRYTLKNFNRVYTLSNEYLQLNLDMVCSLLSSHQLNVSCEEYVFDAVCRWVDYNPSMRKVHMKRLLATVRLGLLPSAVFEGKVKVHRLVLNNPEVQSLIADTDAFLAELDKSEEPDFDMSLPFVRPRVPHEILFVIGGWSGGRPIKMVETYDTRADRWVICKSEDSTPRAYHGVVAIGCLIYVIGGFDATECFNSCRVFDARTKIWSEIAPMNNKRSYVSVALLDGMIYAMGGFEGPPRNPSGVISSPRLRSAERFNPKANQWTLIANMRERRSDASATTFQGEIYICGGFNGSECLCSAEVYNPKTDQWTLIPPMSTRRSGVGVITYNGAIYAVGGFDGVTRTNTAEKYSPSDRLWSPIPDMYNTRSNFGIEVIDDMMFVIGGFNGETTIYNVECYDSQSNEWYNATDMNLYKSALSACVVRDLPDVRDYVYKKADCEDRDQPLLAEGDPVPATSSGAVGQDNQLVMYSSEVERAMSYLTPSSVPSISPSSPMLTSSSSSTSST
uniref:BTB domain-containing protein n=1 Tax=Biomphalaria glabrata TaxID=6526 RepID=A0A2C9JWS5_BIOGL